ncbi:hypothetical protein [Baaleninema simplex]|uniref:hypothetical protein n=1 Tax=Baaleninema simplex TaxID=2862350 RepID=UPI000347DDB2|nr:hypothetical protein [Baaleninema simplex]
MKDKTRAKLQKHVEEIAKILHAEAKSNELKSLEGIEKSARNLTQEYVMSEIGIFFKKKTN